MVQPAAESAEQQRCHLFEWGKDKRRAAFGTLASASASAPLLEGLYVPQCVMICTSSTARALFYVN